MNHQEWYMENTVKIKGHLHINGHSLKRVPSFATAFGRNRLLMVNLVFVVMLLWISLNPLDIETDHVTDHLDMKPTNPGERFCKMRCLNQARAEKHVVAIVAVNLPASLTPTRCPKMARSCDVFFWLKYHEFVHFKSPNYRHVACRNQARTTIVHIWWLACVEIGMDHQTVSPSPLFKHC